MFRKLSGVQIIAAAAYFGVMSAPASAADLGGGCCADLEERVAELEATTATKGNRVVSLKVFGQVSKALLFWDDGFNSEAYVVDNAIAASGIGFSGSAQIQPGLTAGYVIQIDTRDSASFAVSQASSGNPPPVNDIAVRLNHVYIQSDAYGKIALGQNYSFNDAISVPLQLGNTLNTDGTPYSAGFKLINSNGIPSGVTLGRLIGDGPRRGNYLRYDTPNFNGFSATALWGEDDTWDIGAKYLGNVGRIRLHTAIDYFNWDSGFLGAAGLLEKFDDVKALVSIKDLPTGLFLTTWYTQRDYERGFIPNISSPAADTGNAFQFFAGVEKNFTGYGNTTVYGGYGRYQDMASTGLDFDPNFDPTDPTANVDTVIDSEVDRVTLGIVQSIDSAAMDIYGIIEHYSTDLETEAGVQDVEDFTAVIVGSRIKF